MKKLMVTLGVLFALVIAVAAAPTVSSYTIPNLITEINAGLSACSTSTNLTGNIAQARITNALATAGSTIGGNVPVAAVTNAVYGSGTLVTNTCVAADGKTNTYVFAPVGGVYVVRSITTSP
jgi:hypothetical protein